MKPTCIILGGGVIGMMTALEIFRRGWDVSIIEKGECGKESSWAGGGILSPLLPWNEHDAVHAMTVYGQERYPALAETVLHETGIDPECVPSGMLYLKPDEPDRVKTWLSEHEVHYEETGSVYHNQNVPSIFVPGMLQIRNPRIGRGLRAYLLQLGMTIVEQEDVAKIQLSNDRVQSIRVQNRDMEADAFVFACGAWTKQVLEPYGYSLDIKPVKGQIIAIQTPPGTVKTMMMFQSRYLIPRHDGLVLVGSTVEEVGFSKETTDEVKQELLEEAYRIDPQLEEYPVVHHWAGLRPGTGRSVPYICQLPDCGNAYVSAGHFRYGLTLAPASARLLVDLMENKEPVFDVDAFQF